MTTEQVKFILGLLDAEVNKFDPLLNNFMIVFSKDQNLYTDINRWRYKFNTSTNLLERVQVRVYSYSASSLPPHGNYDSYSDSEHPVIIYEYLTDNDGKVLKDFFDFEKILMFIPNVARLDSELVDAYTDSVPSTNLGIATNVKTIFTDMGYGDITSSWIELPEIARINLTNNSSIWRETSGLAFYTLNANKGLLFKKVMNGSNELGVSAIVDANIIIGVETRNAFSASQFAGYDI